MPQTVESKVDCFRMMRQRTSRGLPSWAYKIDLKEIVAPVVNPKMAGETPSNEIVADVCCKIAAALKAHLPAAWFDVSDGDYDRDLDEVYEGLEGLTATSFADSPDYTLLNHLNGKMDELYDWADYARVWIGTV